jgi:adenylate cyclase
MSDSQDGRSIRGQIGRKVTLRTLAANAISACLVVVYLSLVAAGNTGLRTSGDAISLVVTLVYLGIVFPAAAVRARRSSARLEWFEADRNPTPEERTEALRLPARLASQFFTYWVGGAVIFMALNAVFLKAPLGRTVQIGSTIVLGGLITGGLSYLLIERLNRPLFERALADAELHKPATVGVRVRLLLAWTLGSAAIFIGIILAPIGARPGEHPDITGPAVFLAILGLWAGAALTINVASTIADPIESVRQGMSRVRRGDIDVHVAVDDPGEVGLLQAGFNQMVAGLRERKRLEDLFGRHVGIEVARQALERGVEFGGELRDVSALFVDVAGSTTLAAERPPSEVVAMLNDLFSAVVETATAEGGWVNKFEGDAALCVFGAPGTQPDHAARALRMARSLRHAITALSEKHPALDAGIGVSSGQVVAGNVGASERYEYTIIGDPVNVAARLTEEAKARPARVLASHATVEHGGSEATHWKTSGEIQLRGRAGTTEVFEPATLA